VVLVAGLWLFGTGDALLVNAELGNTPWTVLAQGLGEVTGLSIGVLTIVIGAAVLLAWLPLDERPGLGTVANIVVIGIAIDVMRLVLPRPELLATKVAQVLVGVLVVGAGGALYLSTQLGPGPRDGWMTGLHRRFGWPIARVRLGIEVSVLAAGVALGGVVGFGTVAFAVGIGWALGLVLAALDRLVPGRRGGPEGSAEQDRDQGVRTFDAETVVGGAVHPGGVGVVGTVEDPTHEPGEHLRDE